MANSLGIRSYDYIEFYVGSAKMTAFWFAKTLGLKITAYRGPETGIRDRISYYLTKNDLKFVVTSPLQPSTFDVMQFTNQHGDGVKRWSLNVDDVDHAYRVAIKNGAIPIKTPHQQKDDMGFITEAAIRVYDDTEIVFINRDNYKGLFRPGFGKPVQNINLETRETGLMRVDHVVGNVRENEMNVWVNYLNKALDLETFLEFGAGDISTQYSALLSKVVRSKDEIVKNPINEPYEGKKKSQIEEYIEQYKGSGIQHIAISTPDIVSSITALRANGMEFLAPPKTYYKILRDKKFPIKENIDDLEAAGILCDTEGKGYLLQLFSKPISDRPTFFFEIIQRCEGAEGFGQGNFQALFESIELDQAQRGNLDK